MRKIYIIIDRLQNVSLYIFFFSINYEVWDPFKTGGNFSISKLTAILYFCTIFFQLKKYTNIEKLHSVLAPIFMFYVFLVIVSMLNVNDLSTDIFNVSILLNLIAFLFLLNHSRKDIKILDKAMLSFAIGSVCLSLLYNYGIGIEYEMGRVRIFGDNENTIGLRMCISITLLIVFALYDKFSIGNFKYLLYLPVPIMFNLLLETGSRVSALAFGLTVVSFIILYKTDKIFTKVVVMFFGLIMFLYTVILMFNAETLSQRLLKLYYERDLAERDVIWGKLYPFIVDSPIIGHGITGYERFSKNVFGAFVSPHNVFIEVLCYAGVIGLSMYLYFLLQVIKCNYKIYKNRGEFITVLLMIPVFGMIFSGQILNVKIGWVIFSYIIGYSVFWKKEEKGGGAFELSEHKNSLRH